MDEKSLVTSASRGDPAAVDELIERHLPGLRAYIRLRMGPVLRARESCSDLAQSVCREILEHLDRFQYPGENAFKHWMYATALRKIMNRGDYYSAKKRDADRDVRPGESDDIRLSQAYRTLLTPSQDVMAKEHARLLEESFEKLPEDHREVIILARVVGLSHREIAETMGRSETAVRSLLSRALSHLAELFDTSLEDSE